MIKKNIWNYETQITGWTNNMLQILSLLFKMNIRFFWWANSGSLIFAMYSYCRSYGYIRAMHVLAWMPCFLFILSLSGTVIGTLIQYTCVWLCFRISSHIHDAAFYFFTSVTFYTNTQQWPFCKQITGLFNLLQTGFFSMYGGSIKVPLKPLITSSSWCSRGFRGSLSWTAMIPRSPNLLFAWSLRKFQARGILPPYRAPLFLL